MLTDFSALEAEISRISNVRRVGRVAAKSAMSRAL